MLKDLTFSQFMSIPLNGISDVVFCTQTSTLVNVVVFIHSQVTTKQHTLKNNFDVPHETVAPRPVWPQELGLSGERIRQLQLIRRCLREHVVEPRAPAGPMAGPTGRMGLGHCGTGLDVRPGLLVSVVPQWKHDYLDDLGSLNLHFWVWPR